MQTHPVQRGFEDFSLLCTLEQKLRQSLSHNITQSTLDHFFSEIADE